MRYSLRFSGGASVQLIETEFKHSLLSEPTRCIRGKMCGAYEGYGTFQWTRAVQALSILFVQTKLYDVSSATKTEPEPLLIGTQGSLASAIDYSLSKRTNWMSDMFGCDATGTPLALRLLLRTNSNRKRPGPVAIRINSRFLDFKNIHIFSEVNELTTPSELCTLLAQISSETEDEKQPLNGKFGTVGASICEVA